MKTLQLLPVLALVATLAACAHEGPAFNAPPPNVKIVEMRSTLRFAPETLTISRGQTVEWLNKAVETHTVTFDPANAGKPGEISLPAGVSPFDSGDIKSGQVFSHTFAVAGTYHYICMPHHGLGMHGTIVVQ